MRPRIIHIVVAALVLVLWGAAEHHGVARVILGGKADPSHPAVEEGGRRLRSEPPPATVQYSLIGAMASEGRWIGQCAMWPWRMLGSFSFRHRVAPARFIVRAPGHNRINWILPPLP
jgi:hypothetical protein